MSKCEIVIGYASVTRDVCLRVTSEAGGVVSYWIPEAAARQLVTDVRAALIEMGPPPHGRNAP